MLKSFSKYNIRKSDVIHFLKKLSLLMAAGVSVSAALDLAASSDCFKVIAEKVKSGGSLSEALDANVFPPAVIGIISVSEKNGALASGLSRACIYLEKNETFKKKIIGSLIYPAFVLTLCCASIFILVSVLLPSFAGIYQSIGAKMPFLSRMILDSGRYFPLIMVLVPVFIYLFVKHLTGDKGFGFPVIGKFRSKILLASFFNSMSESLSSGMNLIDALSLSAGIMSSKLFKKKLAASIRAVSEGEPLSGALRISGLFDDTVLSLISAGECSSSLDKVFSQLSIMYEEEIESSLKTFTTLIEPASTLATGVVVGIIVFAMFMPIIKLISVLGG